MVKRGKSIYLCRPDKSLITLLNGVKTETVSHNVQVKDYDTLTFDVDEFIEVDGKQVKSNGYDLLDVYLYLYLEDTGYYQMQMPTVNNDGNKETKTITAYSSEKEFENKDWVGLKVNTGDADSLEQLAENNLNDIGYAKEFVVFYRPDKKDLSLLNLILEKMPGWTIIDDDIDPLLWSKKLRIEEDNINLYALLTSVIAPKLECLILFDTVNSRIKAISKERLNDAVYDTNVFIGFRNLEQSVDISTDEDSVFTRFNCRGDGDLTVNDWNYNDSRIFDLSYMMREPYMSDELVEKVKAWVKWRDDNREMFAGLSKQRADINSKIYEIQHRLPDDATDIDQWDNMDEDLLKENLKYYNALLTSLQVSVDTDPKYDSDGNYIPWKKTDGTVDHDAYLGLLYDMANGYGGYYTYLQVLNYIIPNIEIAISNLDVATDDKTDYIEDFETNWELYGTIELVNKKKDYENRLDVLKGYSKPWSELTSDEKAQYPNGEDAYNAAGRSEYVTISGYLGSETTEGSLLYCIAELNKELDSLKDALETVDTNRVDMVKMADISHPQFGFTEDDIVIISNLFHDTDYTNSNILTTSVDTTLTTIDREKELYDDSVSKLSEVSQPQFKFSVASDNLLNIPEFKGWVDDVKLLNFFRVGIKDDYSVKLRLVGYTDNPCEITQELTLEFSSMITSRSGRSDLTELLDSENNRGSKNSITVGTGDSDTDKEYLTSLLQLMISNNLFKNAVGDIAGDTFTGSSATFDEARIAALISKYVTAERIDVEQIFGEEAHFKRFFSEYFMTDYLSANELVTHITTSDVGVFNDLATKIFNAEQASITTLITNSITSEYISTALIEGENGDFIDFVNGHLNIESITTKLLQGENGQTFIDFVNNTISTNTITADVGNIKNVLMGNAGVGELTTIHFTAQNSVIDEAVIKDLIAAKMSVVDLMTHAATAEQFTLISSDGKPAIGFFGATQQFYDSDGAVRLQIGQDTTGEFSFVLKDSTGALLLTPQGITQNAIADGLIVNDMIEDGTVDKSKLNFNVETDDDGNVITSIENIYTGEGGKFGVEYTQFKESTTTEIQGLDQKIEDSLVYDIEILSSNGNIFKNGEISTTLSCHVYKSNVDITDDLNASAFHWTKINNDGTNDEDWNASHFGGTKEIIITKEDVYGRATFNCKVDGIPVSS